MKGSGWTVHFLKLNQYHTHDWGHWSDVPVCGKMDQWRLIMILFNRCAYSSYQLSRFLFFCNSKCMCGHLHNFHYAMPPCFLPWSDVGAVRWFLCKKNILFGTSGGHLEWFVLTEILILHTSCAQCIKMHFNPWKPNHRNSNRNQNIMQLGAKSHLNVIHSKRSQTLPLWWILTHREFVIWLIATPNPVPTGLNIITKKTKQSKTGNTV